jgi:hypothetical protein
MSFDVGADSRQRCVVEAELTQGSRGHGTSHHGGRE